MDSIFTITVFNWQKDNEVPSHRTWGWYPTLEEAQEHMQSGDDLLFESDTYTWGLIEEVPVGAPILIPNEERYWFCKTVGERWAGRCSEPEWANQVVNFSMG